MRVYDFDDTVYRGDSTVDFYLYCLRKYPKILCLLPGFGWAAFRYGIKRIEKKEMKTCFFQFLRFLPDVNRELEEFWKKYKGRLKGWYLEQKQESDLIISASPYFLLEPICKELGVRLIASPVDKNTGLYTGENCWGPEKVNRFYEEIGQMEPEEFYSDSVSDTPMAKIARKAFLVTGDRIEPWPEK